MFVNQSQQFHTLVLLDNDPIFVLGLKEVLKDKQFQDLDIIATGKIEDFSRLITEYNPSLWIIVLDFNKYPEKIENFFRELPQIEKEYPKINILLLSPTQELNLNIQSISDNLKGYCYKNLEIEQLVKVFRLTARGKNYDSFNFFSPEKNNVFQYWLYRQCREGIKQIEKEIIEITMYLEQGELSLINILYWQGRKRELKLAKWLVKKVLPVPQSKFSSSNISNTYNDQNNILLSSQSSGKNINQEETNEDNKIESDIVFVSSWLNSYDITLEKIKGNLKNSTNVLQEIDILRNSKKQELLILILKEWSTLIEELQKNNFNEMELTEKVNPLMKEIWQNSTIKFLNRYLETSNETEQDLNIVNYIFIESKVNLEENLYSIPFITDIILYELLKKDLVIDNKNYPFNSDSAEAMKEIIIQNMIITMGNYVMTFILNKFYDNLTIKHNLFKPELKSSRKVAMFRNDLVWKYRREKYWSNPRNIFEDEYIVYKLTPKGIETCKIRDSRHQELSTIRGIPWGVTILIELRDSLAKGVKALEDGLGKLLVYVLTEVVGKGIGLIGKGILQGIGSRIKN